MPTHPHRSRRWRPREHLRAASQLYPLAWRRADGMRADRGRTLPPWPEWCYLPMAGWYAIVAEDARLDPPLPLQLVGDVARLAALGAWRMTQGIYRFERQEHYAELIQRPVIGDLLVMDFYRLPEWCVYVETPVIEATRVRDDLLLGEGFFAHLEWDANTGRTELRFLIDLPSGQLLPTMIHLADVSLDESIARAIDTAQITGAMHGAGTLPANFRSRLRPTLTALVSLTAHLCAVAAQGGFRGDKAGPRNPEPRRVKGKWKVMPASRPALWII